jgi:nucleotide-binding universal stress UspA family protein
LSDFPRKILLATDASEDAMLASRAAISLANDTGAELHVVHVGPAHVYPPRAAGPTPPMGTDKEIRPAERLRRRTYGLGDQRRRSCTSARR